MFKATIKAERLKQTIDALTSLVDEARFKLTENGLVVRAVDPANVAMVSLELSKEGFEQFEATESELGIDLTKIKSLLEMADKSDNIELGLDEESHKFKIKTGNLDYSVGLLDPESIRKEPKIPKLDLPARISLKGEHIQRAIKATFKVAEYMMIGVRGTILFFEAEGDADKICIELAKDQLIQFQPAEVKSLYSLDYLADISKILGTSDGVELHLGKDMPLEINLKIADGHGDVKIMLAPRVEKD